MSEEAKTVDPESRSLEVVEEKIKPELSPEEKEQLIRRKMDELKEAGIDLTKQSLQMPQPPGGYGAGAPGMDPGVMARTPGGISHMMTSMGAPPPMASAPPPPMPHIPDPAHQHPEKSYIPKDQRRFVHQGKTSDAPEAVMVDNDLVQLSPMAMLEIELLTAETKAADAEERLATINLRDVRERVMVLHRKRGMLMSRITNQLGVDSGKSIRLVDKEQRLCKIED